MNPHPPLSWGQHARNNFQQGALPGTIPSDESENLTAGDTEADPANGLQAAIANAQRVVDLGHHFVELVLGYRIADRPRPGPGEWRATSAESAAMAGDLKRLGFRFFGPTTAYAMMQAIGLVDDHVAGCFAPPPVWPK